MLKSIGSGLCRFRVGVLARQLEKHDCIHYCIRSCSLSIFDHSHLAFALALSLYTAVPIYGDTPTLTPIYSAPPCGPCLCTPLYGGVPLHRGVPMLVYSPIWGYTPVVVLLLMLLLEWCCWCVVFVCGVVVVGGITPPTTNNTTNNCTSTNNSN
jgi:hypothetical protein